MNAFSQFWRDPHMPHVESRRACDSRACYKPHSHPTCSIGAVDQGSSLFTGPGGGTVELRPGTVVFVPPDRIHACNPFPDTAWSYQMLHVDAHWLQSIRRDGDGAGDDHDRMQRTWITREPAVYRRFSRLNDLLFSNAAAHDKQDALIEFIRTLDGTEWQAVDAPANDAAVASRHHDQLARVLDHLLHAPAPAASLDELARMADMSRYQLIRAFRAMTGITPHAWQLNQRINQARKMIQAGEDFAEIAYGLGFADQSHFQRVFKAHTAITPGRYRI